MSEFHYTPLPRVCSIQSHVVCGYVGNRAAVLPLQLLNFEVDFINSVQFSNHTGYPTFRGQVLSGDELATIQSGLEENNLCDYDYVLTGYIGSESFLTSVLASLDIVLAAKPEALFICDPVLGDEGKYYVPKELVNIYREKVIPRAFMITPNQFEAELLSEMKISTEKSAVMVAKKLHSMGPRVVIVTSCEVTEYPGKLLCLALSKDTTNDKYVVNRVVVDKLEGRFTGTGDVTTALLLGHGHKSNRFTNMGDALSKTMATIRSVIDFTRNKGQRILKKLGNKVRAIDTMSPSERSLYMRTRELALIESQEIIRSPPATLKAETLFYTEEYFN
jgi:pyridoxine kinase